MKNTLLSIIMLAGSAFSSVAQTTLQAGDIAFVGIQSGQSGVTSKDRFGIILLKNIEANTKIEFTDKVVRNYTPVWFCGGEGYSKWTSTTALAAGTIISISEDSVTNFGIAQGGLSLSQSGEQVFALQVNNQDTIMIAGISTTGWETTCDAACSSGSSNSCLPANLVNGITAIGFPNERNNAFFNLDALSGTPSEILAAINNPANWTQEDVLQTWPTWSVSVVTSVKGLKANKIIKLTPDISDGNFTIENTSCASVELSIHNLLGQSQFSDMLPVGKKEYSLSALPKGIYFAKTKDLGGKQSVIRFQISK